MYTRRHAHTMYAQTNKFLYENGNMRFLFHTDTYCKGDGRGKMKLHMFLIPRSNRKIAENNLINKISTLSVANAEKRNQEKIFFKFGVSLQ